MTKLAPGRKAPPFELKDQDGNAVSLESLLASGKGAAVLWLCNHCPYVVAYMGRLVALDAEFPDIRFVGINSNDPRTYPEDAPDKMPAFAREHGAEFPYLFDETQDVARAYGVERTPEIFLLGPDGVCVYEGGVDDNWNDPNHVTDRPLRDALAALSAGKPIERPQTFATGCSIKWKNA
ncbi:MAG: thioredoxin family protein [Phycisphaerales bacterium]|nr:thioredoxin family protein [Phycisphaerales bacterium]